MAHLSLRTPFPDNPSPRAIGFKDDDISGNMMPVQSEHRVPEAALRVCIRIAGKRIVDAVTPAEFLKGSQDGDLIPGGLAKPFDYRLANPQLSEVTIPSRFQLAGSGLRVTGGHDVPS